MVLQRCKPHARSGLLDSAGRCCVQLVVNNEQLRQQLAPKLALSNETCQLSLLSQFDVVRIQGMPVTEAGTLLLLMRASSPEMQLHLRRMRCSYFLGLV